MNKKTLRRAFTRVMLAALFAPALLLNSCKKEKNDKALASHFRKMDSFLRGESFHYDSMNFYLATIAGNFVNGDEKELSFEQRRASVQYLWNSDSSITMLNAHKIFDKGFNREAIIHAGDSILFVYRFSTEPLGLESRQRFTFLEEVFYMTMMGTIKHLARISYRETNLQDTIAFRKKPFADLKDNISHFYSLELNHSQNILTLN
jgi:hypothetical protein